MWRPWGRDGLAGYASLSPCFSHARRREDEGRERRQRHGQRPGPSMRGYLLGGDVAGIADIAAAVMLGIGIEPLDIGAAERHADAVAIAHQRREIAHDDSDIALVAAAA